MARDYSFWRRTGVALGILAAMVVSARFAIAQSTLNQATSGGVDWHVPENWSPTGIPNATDAEVILNAPMTTTPDNGFTINLQATDATIGSLTVENFGFNNGYTNRINDDGGKLIFHSTSGPATYTETAGTSSTGPGRFQINADISLLSDFVMTTDNIPDLNTGTIFAGLVNGASTITFTKQGAGNLQLNYSFPLGAGEGFEGQYVINQGGIRMLATRSVEKSTGITVNAGGQLQLTQNAIDWTLAGSSALALNGNGKDSGNAADGALRFQLSSGFTANFNSPTTLATDARITSAPANATAVLTNVVSGDGGLTKSGPGTLILNNSSNSYAGDTRLLAGGPLSITSPFLPTASDVYLVAGSVLNLNFTGTNVVDSLFIDGASQATGLWGATGNTSADFQTDLITGNGLLDVQTFVAQGLAGDYNEDGTVDAADYVLWRKNLDTNNPLPNDDDLGTPITSAHYDLWRANFGAMESGSGGGGVAVVPEPGTAVLALLALFAIAFRPKRAVPAHASLRRVAPAIRR